MQPGTVKNFKILIGCFIIQMLICGVGRLSAIYFVESITRFDVDRKQASFPFVLIFLVKNLMGPLVGYLEQLFGIRWIIIIGCLMYTIGIGCCFFAEDILVITLLWGVILGLGLGFAFNLQAPLLSQHFGKNKNKANAFVLTGSSVGGILLPIATTSFIQTFGVSGSFLVLSAVVAHCIPASLLLENFTGNKNAAIPIESKETLNSKSDKINTNPFKISDDVECLSIKKLAESQAISESTIQAKNLKYSTSNPKPVTALQLTNTQNVNRTSEPISNKNKFTLRNFRIFIDPTFLVILTINGVNLNVVMLMFTIILDFVRDKNVPKYLEIYYVVILSISDIIGRLIAGYIMDKKFFTFSNFSFITFLINAIIFVSIVHIENFILLMVFVMLLSICMGITIILQVTMTDDFIEEDLRKMSHSCRFLLYAPLSLPVSPMIGYFRGEKGSYDNIFYISSGAVFLCGCLAHLLPYFSRRKLKEKANNV